ncbi:hypothetical protein N9D23_05165 [Rubripirellula sp.]|nr:hypothetical protein [Rubripirellula sp.]
MIQRDPRKAEAERLRDDGMNRAAASKPDRVTLGRVALLEALLRSPDRTGTIDDATSDDAIGSAFQDGGKWRGTITRSLAADGLIERVGFDESNRPSRHCGPVGRWRLVDPLAARRYVERLRVALSDQQKTGSAVAPAKPAESGFANTSQEAKRNGQAI